MIMTVMPHTLSALNRMSMQRRVSRARPLHFFIAHWTFKRNVVHCVASQGTEGAALPRFSKPS